jgi:hypothetical protein
VYANGNGTDVVVDNSGSISAAADANAIYYGPPPPACRPTASTT